MLCLSVLMELKEAELASCAMSVRAKTAATRNAIFLRVMCQPSPEVRLANHTKGVAGEIRPYDKHMAELAKLGEMCIGVVRDTSKPVEESAKKFR